MVATDPDALTEAVERLRAMDSGAGRDDLALLRRLGYGLIALGRCAEAVPVLDRAVALASAAGTARAEVAVRINLGDAHRYGGDQRSAGEQYDRALDLARGQVPDLVDFALQHKGKHLIDTGRPEEAVRCLQEALTLRRAKGDPELIRSTVAALDLARMS